MVIAESREFTTTRFAAGLPVQSAGISPCRGGGGSVILPAMDTPSDAVDRATAHHQAGRLADAEVLYRQVLRARPDHPAALNGLAMLAYQIGRFDTAAALFRRAAEASPDVAFRINLAAALRALGRLGEAEGALRQALAQQPEQADALNNLGMVWQGQARVEAAVRSFRRAVMSRPGHAEARANLAYYTQFLPGVTLRQVAAVHRAMAPAPPPRPRPPRDAAERPLVLGFVSGDFRRHQVAAYVVRGLEGLAALGSRVVLYANQAEADDMTARLRSAAALWRPILGLSDEAVADLVRDDGIDVLFDLSGHFARHRLGVFARRAAPLQVAWAGYMATTGVAEMDAIVADPREVPPGAEAQYGERVLRLPHAWICWDPPAAAPEPGPPPAERQGHVTFGSLNTPAKLNGAVLRLWARLLRTVPDSRLLLRYKGLDEAGVAARLRDAFAAEGIAADRLTIEGGAAHAAFLDTYRRIDVALDPFPFSGSITTCEALWMGVPVVTLPGETFASRHSLSILHALGLGGLAAADAGDFVGRAAMLAADAGRRLLLRRELRPRMAASPLCDGRRFAADLLAALRREWLAAVKG